MLPYVPQDPRVRFRRLFPPSQASEPAEAPQGPAEAPPTPTWLYAEGERGPGTCSLHRQLVALFADGATIELAAAAAGLEGLDLARWIYAGAEGDTDFRRLYIDVRAATAKAQLDAIREVRQARDVKGNPLWPARRWFVECLAKGSYEPTPREVAAPGVPASKADLLRELRKSVEAIELEVARDALVRQGESASAVEIEERREGGDDAGDRSEDTSQKERQEGPE
jgi:hypothetical protein